MQYEQAKQIALRHLTQVLEDKKREKATIELEIIELETSIAALSQGQDSDSPASDSPAEEPVLFPGSVSDGAG